MEALTHNISYADLMHRGRPRVIATAVIQSATGVTLVDPGPTSCLGRLRIALTDSGVEIRDVREKFQLRFDNVYFEIQELHNQMVPETLNHIVICVETDQISIHEFEYLFQTSVAIQK